MWRNRLRERDGQIGKASVAVHVDRLILSAVNNIPDKTLATKPSLGSEGIQEMRHVSWIVRRNYLPRGHEIC